MMITRGICRLGECGDAELRPERRHPESRIRDDSGMVSLHHSLVAGQKGLPQHPCSARGLACSRLDEVPRLDFNHLPGVGRSTAAPDLSPVATAVAESTDRIKSNVGSQGARYGGSHGRSHQRSSPQQAVWRCSQEDKPAQALLKKTRRPGS